QEAQFISRLVFQRRALERLTLPKLYQLPIEAITMASRDWACVNLVELNLRERAPENPIDAIAFWSNLYSRFGRLTNLETLHLICNDMGKTVLDGGQQEVSHLMVAAPSLEYLDLAPLIKAQYNVTSWLGRLGKGGILKRRE
ncbi:hypothetical protein BGZ47_002340, partial [Haplosporangium gracile]